MTLSKTITLFPLEDSSGFEGFHPYTIILDGLTRKQFIQKACRGLYRNSQAGSTVSSRCQKCGHVLIGQVPGVCAECGSTTFSIKNTNECWAICDSIGIPMDLLGDYDPLPEFWIWHEDDDNAEFTDGLIEFEDAFIHPDDVENSYRIEAATENEIMEELGSLDGIENIYPDVSQDWVANLPCYHA